MSIKNVYETGKVVRYHANPHLSVYGQTVADHAWGCAMLIHMLHPNPTKELLATALLHDAGERWAGDLPYPVKVIAPEMAERHSFVEKALAGQNGVPEYHITKRDAKWLKFVDRLEAFLFVKMRRPDLAMGEDWQDNNDAVMEMAEELGVPGDEVYALIHAS